MPFTLTILAITSWPVVPAVACWKTERLSPEKRLDEPLILQPGFRRLLSEISLARVKLTMLSTLCNWLIYSELHKNFSRPKIDLVYNAVTLACLGQTTRKKSDENFRDASPQSICAQRSFRQFFDLVFDQCATPIFVNRLLLSPIDVRLRVKGIPGEPVSDQCGNLPTLGIHDSGRAIPVVILDLQ